MDDNIEGPVINSKGKDGPKTRTEGSSFVRSDKFTIRSPSISPLGTPQKTLRRGKVLPADSIRDLNSTTELIVKMDQNATHFEEMNAKVHSKLLTKISTLEEENRKMEKKIKNNKDDIKHFRDLIDKNREQVEKVSFVCTIS